MLIIVTLRYKICMWVALNHGERNPKLCANCLYFLGSTCPLRVDLSGLYEFNVMPFMLQPLFQRSMQKVLAGLESFCSVYIDVFSETVEKHVGHRL